MEGATVTRQKVPLKSPRSRSCTPPPVRIPQIPPDPPVDEIHEEILNGELIFSSMEEDGGLSDTSDPVLRGEILADQEDDGVILPDVEHIRKPQLEATTHPEVMFEPITRLDTDLSIASSMSFDEESGTGGGNGGRLRRRRFNTFSDDEIKNIPRLVHRNLPFKQSRQEIAVYNKTIFRSLKLQRILSEDWYHILLRQPTWFSIFCLLFTWTFFIIVFALIYQKIDRDSPQTECGLGKLGDPIAFTPAFAFSLETCTTVGYGLPNSTNGFFESECLGLQIAIYFQMTW